MCAQIYLGTVSLKKNYIVKTTKTFILKKNFFFLSKQVAKEQQEQNNLIVTLFYIMCACAQYTHYTQHI